MTIAIKPESIREPTCACGQGVAAASMTGAALPVDSGWTAHGPCSASMPRNCAEKQATRRPCARSCRRLGRVSVI